VEDMELVYPLKEDEETKAIPSSICVSKGLKPNYSGETCGVLKVSSFLIVWCLGKHLI